MRSALIKTGGVALFVALTIASSKIRIILPFSPVPMTMQPMAVLLAGAVLGPWLGTASQLVYIMLGLSGMPVFAGLPGAGPLVLIGPTGGYLMSYPIASFVAGWLSRKTGALVRTALALSAGLAIIYLFGLLHLALVTGTGGSGALVVGIAPFILKDLVSVGIASLVVVGLRSITRARKQS